MPKIKLFKSIDNKSNESAHVLQVYKDCDSDEEEVFNGHEGLKLGRN